MAKPPLPLWIDRLRPLAGVFIAAVPLYGVAILYYGGSPRTTAVGYQPEQPVAYSHALHVGELGIDCRYCHNTVESASQAAIPPTATCMNCHAKIATDSTKLLRVRQSAADGMPIPWRKVHDLPDYVYFDHSAHVNRGDRGVGCVTCHGRVDRMERVYQAERLSMGWCLECHRRPESRLRPRQHITTMDWTPTEPHAAGLTAGESSSNRNPLTDCTTCHR